MNQAQTITSERAAEVARDATSRVRRTEAPLPVVLAGALGIVALASATRRSSRFVGRTALGAVAGALAGAAMSRFQALWSAAEQKLGHEAGPSSKPATVAAAEAIVGPIPEDEQPRAGTIAHYVMAGATGAIYGAASTVFPRLAIGRGLAYGAAVWLFADETMVPLARLSAPPWTFPLVTHVHALLAHLVYGAVLDAGMRGTARVFG